MVSSPGMKFHTGRISDEPTPPERVRVDGCPMGENLSAVAGTQGLAKRRPQAHTESTGLRRNPLGPAQWCSLEGLTRPISIPEHLLASSETMGRIRCLADDLADLSRTTRRRGATRLVRDLCRWYVFPGKKGGSKVGKTKRGKGSKLMVVADGQGVPLGVLTASASPAEVKLIEDTLKQAAVPVPPENRDTANPQPLIYDRAADSDPLRQRLSAAGVELVCPHRRGRVRPKTQDGRKLRRYKRRWTIERTISWLGNFRRLLIPWERYPHIFQAFIHVACIIIVLRRL
jgi:transposase